MPRNPEITTAHQQPQPPLSDEQDLVLRNWLPQLDPFAQLVVSLAMLRGLGPEAVSATLGCEPHRPVEVMNEAVAHSRRFLRPGTDEPLAYTDAQYAFRLLAYPRYETKVPLTSFGSVLWRPVRPGTRTEASFTQQKVRIDGLRHGIGWLAIHNDIGEPTLDRTKYVALAMLGLKNAAIAQILTVTSNTVRTHLHLYRSSIGHLPRAGFALHGLRAKKYSVDVPGQELDLTERELDIVRLICEGKENGKIASELNLGVNTIKSHINRITAKNKLRGSRARIALAALLSGQVPYQ